MDGELVSCPKPARIEKTAPKRVKRTSVKHAASEVVYDKNRAIRLQSNPVCERCGMFRASVVHHILPRSAGGGHELSNLKSLCNGPASNGCHDAVHAAPEDSYREGFLRRRFPREGDFHFYDPKAVTE